MVLNSDSVEPNAGKRKKQHVDAHRHGVRVTAVGRNHSLRPPQKHDFRPRDHRVVKELQFFLVSRTRHQCISEVPRVAEDDNVD